MYKKHFGLQENPFNVTPDPRYLYLTPHTREALACMTYCVQARKGFALLTGDVGTGKTTLLNKLLEWLRQEQIPSAFVFNPRLNPFQFLDYTLSDFGVNCQSRLKSAILAELNNWLLERYRAGTTAVLIVDEAQDASPELLEEIRLLTNLETPSGKLLQIVLSGQQELEMRLRLPEFRQLRQRITLRAKTYPLTPTEVHEYIATRLRIAGSDGRPLFAEDAIDALYQYSEGIPSVINILCEDSLIGAYADHEPLVTKKYVEGAAKELELDVYPATAPPPRELTIDDIVQPGSVTFPKGPPTPQGATAVRAKPVAEQPIAQEPAPATLVPPARIPAAPVPLVQAEPVLRNDGQPAPLAKSAEWEASLAASNLAWPEAAAQPAQRPSDVLLSPQRPPAAARSVPNDEVLTSTLRTAEPPPKPQPVSPAARPAPAAPKPAPNPPRPVKSSEGQPIGWVLVVAVLIVVMLGGVMAIMLIKQLSQVETPAPVTTPVPEPATPPAAPVPTATSEVMGTAETSAAGIAATPPVQAAPAPSPVTQAPSLVEEAADKQTPPERPPQRERRSVPVSERPRTVTQVRPERSAAPVPAASVGSMVVWANVDGARITVDGRSMPDWITPREFRNIPTGNRRVIVSKPGYVDAVGSVVIESGKTAAFNAQLAPMGGEISVITNPPGLGVSIDGGPFIPSPVQTSVSVGQHTYRIQLPDGRIHEGAFEMRSGAVITRRVNFSAGERLNPEP